MDHSALSPAEARGRATYRALSASSVGIEIAIAVTLGVLGGRWLDQRLGTEPWLFYLGTSFGCAAAVQGLLRANRRLAKLDGETDAEASPNGR